MNFTLQNMAPSHKHRYNKPFWFQELESYNRITSIPLINRSWKIAGTVYGKIKGINSLVFWTLEQAEQSFEIAVDTTAPIVILFRAPITNIDRVICKTLDIAEQKVPYINSPPELMYSETKQYISSVGNKIVRPVLKRADSVKQIGTTVLSSKYTEYAADKLDGALGVADVYVDKYLPAERYDYKTSEEPIAPANGPAGKTINAMQHVDRFSRKLTRRLTKRTIEEAKILKEHSTEAIHVCLYVAELIATDPVLAFQKGKELWASLSKDEPENQARPQNLEQLVVLLVRETSRRVVHFVNFSFATAGKIPTFVNSSIHHSLSMFLAASDSIMRSVHLEGIQEILVKVAKVQAHTFTVLLKQLNAYISNILEEMAQNLAPAVQNRKGALAVPQIQFELKASNTSKVSKKSNQNQNKTPENNTNNTGNTNSNTNNGNNENKSNNGLEKSL